MKNIYRFGGLMAILFAAVISVASSGGRAGAAGSGNTGAPSSGGGMETTCIICHNGGPYGTPNISVTIQDAMGSAVNSYVPGQTYSVTVMTTANNNPVAYGFQSVFLDVPAGGTVPVQAGSITNTSTGTNAVELNSRTYIEQSERSATGTWSFDWTAPAVGTGLVRYYVASNAVNGGGTGGDNTASVQIDIAEGTLPLTLADFQGSATKQTVDLTWVTSLEDQTSHFEIQRSVGGGDFRAVGRIPAAGQSNTTLTYAFTDTEAPRGELTYRLRMEDLDGSFTYSPLVPVRTTGEELTVYPNPATDFVQLPVSEGNTSVRILSAEGRPVRTLSSPTPRLDVRDLAPGIYLLEVTEGDERRVTRFVKR